MPHAFTIRILCNRDGLENSKVVNLCSQCFALFLNWLVSRRGVESVFVRSVFRGRGALSHVPLLTMSFSKKNKINGAK